MANKDAAFGFRPVRHLTGGDLQANEYTIAANLGHDIFHGQCVKAVTAGGLVYDDPRIVFEVQHDGTGTAAMNFAAFDFVGQAGSSATGRSTQELDTSTAGTSGQFKQIGISKDPDNSDTSSANVNVYVIPNTAEHSYLLTTALS